MRTGNGPSPGGRKTPATIDAGASGSLATTNGIRATVGGRSAARTPDANAPSASEDATKNARRTKAATMAAGPWCRPIKRAIGDSFCKADKPAREGPTPQLEDAGRRGFANRPAERGYLRL